MSEFIKVATTANIADGNKVVLDLNGRFVVLVRVDGKFFCIDDVCTHDGGPLGEGRLDGFQLACPRHGAKFDIRDGKAVTMPATEDTVTHEVKVEGTEVYVKLRED